MSRPCPRLSGKFCTGLMDGLAAQRILTYTQNGHLLRGRYGMRDTIYRLRREGNDHNQVWFCGGNLIPKISLSSNRY